MKNIVDQDLSRRVFMEKCAFAAFGLSILSGLRGTSAFADEPAPAVKKGPGFGSARHIIWLRLKGGVSHIDTFDPKSGKSKGPASPVATKAGFQLTDYLPKTAEVASKICVIRSMTAKVGVHEDACYLMRTGYEKRGTILHPGMGAWLQQHLGASHKTLPSSVCVNAPAQNGNGFFPPSFSPLPVLDPEAGLQNSSSQEGYVRLESRLALANELDRNFRGKHPDANVAAYADFYDAALRLMKSKDLKAFDVAAEADKTRDAYGRNKFGQGCLLARRLVESGVRFVEVEHGGAGSDDWDMHNNLEERMKDMAPQFDNAYAALLQDLDARGLLANTLVAATTEFGRKPSFDGNGRGHHPTAFASVLAGAGVKRGFVYGATDDLGAAPKEKPVTVGDLHATIGWAAGVPLEKQFTAPNGRPFTVGNNGKPALEVFA
ncbi:MAG TPA: DUF1501 domain-containing protein [Planctomycetota bacterium]|nr:DUF1501 domain-containing protein [Planctomycetota bacterium]